MSCAQYVAAFGFQLYIVPVAACGIDLAQVDGGLRPGGFFNPAASLSEGIRVEEGAVPAEILAGDPGVNVVYDGETITTQAVFQLRGITNASLETDTSTEAIITYDEEGKGFDQNVALSKSWTLSIEAVSNFTDSAYKVIRLLETNAVSGQLKAKVGRLGPTGTTESIYGYCTVSNFSESVEAGGIVTWSCELQGYGPLALELDNSQSINLVGPISTLSIFNAGASLKDGTYPDYPLTGGSGNGLATADILVNAGQVASVTLVDAGDGYQELNNLGANLPGADVVGTISTLLRSSNGGNLANGTYPAVALTGGSGTGATANITVSGNIVTAHTLAAAGSGYQSGNTLSADLNPQANPVAGEVLTLSGLVSGSGYDDGIYNSLAVTGGAGTGLLLNITVSGQAVTSATVANGGTGYDVGDDFTASLDPATIPGTYAITGSSLSNAGEDLNDGSFVGVSGTGGAGSGAVADFTVVGGVVTSYTLTAAGTGYATGNTLTFNLQGLPNPQAGQIYTLDAGTLIGGSGYQDGTYLAVSLTGGAGTGATADIVVVSGAVTSVTLVSGGTDYIGTDFMSASDANLGGAGGSGFSIEVGTVDELTQVSHIDPVLTVSSVDSDAPAVPTPWSISAASVEPDFLTANQPSFSVTAVATVEATHTDPVFRVSSLVPN